MNIMKKLSCTNIEKEDVISNYESQTFTESAPVLEFFLPDPIQGRIEDAAKSISYIIELLQHIGPYLDSLEKNMMFLLHINTHMKPAVDTSTKASIETSAKASIETSAEASIETSAEASIDTSMSEEMKKIRKRCEKFKYDLRQIHKIRQMHIYWLSRYNILNG